jgi:hypothetical protein
MPVRGYRMKVITVDRHGRQKGPAEWVDVPPADRFTSNGISHIRSFVTRVLSSEAESSWITIGTPSGRNGIGIGKQNGRISVDLSVNVRRPTREAAIRMFFVKRGIPACRDYVASNGGVPNSVRVLEYPLQCDAGRISKLAADLLKSVYRLTSRSALDIGFTERQQPNNAIDGDTVRSPLRAPHGARHCER